MLAIAGLIFLMVFIALPQLQRAQRDTQRRQNISKVATALTQYQTNNGGKIPSPSGGAVCDSADAAEISPNNYSGNNPACSFIAKCLNSSQSSVNDFTDPDGSHYGLRLYGPGYYAEGDYLDGGSRDGHYIIVYPEAKCKGEQAEYTGAPRDFSVVYTLEGSGSACVDNQ